MTKINNRLTGCVRWPAITVAARDFGVHRATLYRVLSGKRPDARRYRDRYALWRRVHGV